MVAQGYPVGRVPRLGWRWVNVAIDDDNSESKGSQSQSSFNSMTIVTYHITVTVTVTLKKRRIAGHYTVHTFVCLLCLQPASRFRIPFPLFHPPVLVYFQRGLMP